MTKCFVTEAGGAVDVDEAVQLLRDAGIRPPVLLRFPDIASHRLAKLQARVETDVLRMSALKSSGSSTKAPADSGKGRSLSPLERQLPGDSSNNVAPLTDAMFRSACRDALRPLDCAGLLRHGDTALRISGGS